MVMEQGIQITKRNNFYKMKFGNVVALILFLTLTTFGSERV